MPIELLQSISAEHPAEETIAALRELRTKMPSLSSDDIRSLHNEVLAKQAELAISADESVLQELQAIEEQLAAMSTSTIQDTIGAYVNDGIESISPVATKVVDATKETAGNAASMIREEVQGTMLNPNIPVSEKVVRYAGLGLIGYSAFKLAQWFLAKDPVAKPPTTFMGKLGSWLWRGAKVVGIATLAGMAVNRFAPKNAPTPVPSATL